MASLQSNINNLQSILTTVNNLPEQNIEKKGYKLTIGLTMYGTYPRITINGKELEYSHASYHSDLFTLILTNIVKVNIISNIHSINEPIDMTLLEDTVLELDHASYGEDFFIDIMVETGNSYGVCILGEAIISTIEPIMVSPPGDGFSLIQLDPVKEYACIRCGLQTNYYEIFIEFYEGDTWGSYLFSTNNILPFEFTDYKEGKFHIDKNTGNIYFQSAAGPSDLVVMDDGNPVNIFDPIKASTFYEATYSNSGFGGQ